MKPIPKNTLPEAVKVLTESEIQDRLYGGTLGRRKSSSRQEVVSVQEISDRSDSHRPESQSQWKGSHEFNAAEAGKTVPEWTGAEILAGELKRLRDELLTLRKERDRLAQELNQHMGSVSSKNSPVSFVSNADDDLGKRSRNFFWRLFGFVILLGGLGTPFGFRLLQAAAPMGGDPTPYTVQVAVYDVRSMADRALLTLQELGYSAFLVDMPRRDGRSRYRIYVGEFVTKEEADLERLRLSTDPRFPDAFVRIQ